MTDNLPDYFSINAWQIDCQRNLAWLGDKKVLVEPESVSILQQATITGVTWRSAVQQVAAPLF
ncbi:hypothetical protein [Shewanella sp. c952]|uniref:hypothetical protein n=1 Tax=Shewanella sp. c952 TaxID=2815913 RepID=UPI001C7E0BB1|nr:hypothetical protein [Shewanella sp. c952]